MIKGIWWAPVMAFVGLAAVVTWTAIDPAFAPASTRAHVTAPRKTAKVARPAYSTALAAPRPRGANVLAQFLNPEGFAWAPPVKYRFSADPGARLGMTENAIGDVTGDGRPDLVALSTNYTDTATRWKVWIYAQTPQGNLAAPYTVSYNEGLSDVPWYYPFSGLNLADYDRDGKLDIAVGYAFGLQVLKSDGKGGFTKTPYRMPSTHKYAVQSMATFDVDRDGDLDVLQFSSSVLEQTLYLNDGQGHFGTGLHIRVPGELERDYEDHKVLDFDGDGYQDLMVLWRGQLSIGLPDTVVVYRNVGYTSGTFGAPYLVVPMEPYWTFDSLAAGDFDGDGVLEIVVGRPSNQPGSFVQFVRRTAGAWALAERLPVYDVANSLYAGDVDGDGRDDLVIDHKGWGALSLYSDGDWANRTLWLVTLDSSTPHIPRAIALGDLNGDGCTDAAVSDNNWDQIMLWAVRCHKHRVIATDSGWKSRVQ
jgi:hypothetical protein